MGSGGTGNGRQPEEAGCLLLYSAFWYNQRENRKGNNKKCHFFVKPSILHFQIKNRLMSERW